MLEKIRKVYANELLKSENEQIIKLAEYIQDKDTEGRKPCWGKIISKVNELFESDDQKIELWKQLIKIPEENSLMLFIIENKKNEKILDESIKDIEMLPIPVQKMLISLNESSSKISKKNIESLSEEIQAYNKQNKKKKNAELELMEQRINNIKSIDACLGHSLDADHNHDVV